MAARRWVMLLGVLLAGGGATAEDCKAGVDPCTKNSECCSTCCNDFFGICGTPYVEDGKLRCPLAEPSKPPTKKYGGDEWEKARHTVRGADGGTSVTTAQPSAGAGGATLVEFGQKSAAQQEAEKKEAERGATACLTKPGACAAAGDYFYLHDEQPRARSLWKYGCEKDRVAGAESCRLFDQHFGP